MIEIYVPEEISFKGVTYSADTKQEVPQEVANFIQNDPTLSKIKPKPKVDKFGQFKNQSIEAIKAHIEGYETAIAYWKKQIATYVKMNNPVPKKLLLTLKNDLEELAEFKEYMEPFMKVKEAEELEERSKFEAFAQSKGIGIKWHSDGSYTEYLLPRKRIYI